MTDFTPGSGRPSGTLGTEPFPRELVDVDEYVDELADAIERKRFPELDADLVPELTKARFVADGARNRGNVEFTDRIERLRETMFEPLVRFEAVSALADERRRDRLDRSEIAELVSKAGLDGEAVTPDADLETLVDDALDDRESTFFDYPAPPLHVVESAESRGHELLDETPDRGDAAGSDERRTYVRHRTTVEAVVVGARDVATEAYDDVIERIRAESPSNRAYEDAETYAEVVAFNAALAGEAMLEEDGKLTTPP